MNRILYIIAVIGLLLITGGLQDYRVDINSQFIIGIVAAFLALSVAMIAFNLSVQQRNRLTPFLALAFLSAGTFELLHALFVKGVILNPVGSVENYNTFGALFDQTVLSIILAVGLMRAVNRPGIWVVLPYYSALAVVLAGGAMIMLTRVPLPDLVWHHRFIIHRPLELLPCIGYATYIAIALKTKPVIGKLRERNLATAFIPCVLVLLVSQAISSMAAMPYQGTYAVANSLKIFAYLLAIVPAMVNLWRYAQYSFQVASTRLTTLFGVALFVLAVMSIVQFNSHESEISSSDEQFLVDLLRKQQRLNRVEYAVQNYMSFADDAYLEDFDSIWILQREIVELFRGNIDSVETEALVARFDELQAMSQKILDINAPDEISHKIYLAEQVLNLVRRLQGHLGKVLESETAKLPVSRGQKLDDLHEQLVFELGLLLTFILITFIVSRRYYQRQIQPVIHLTEVAEKITSGSRYVEIKSDRNDELGKLGQSLNAMLRYLRAAVDELENRVEERTEELSRSEQQLRNIMDHVEEGIVTANNRGIIQSVNPAVCKIFGYDAQQLVGGPIYKLMPEEKRETHITTISRYSDPENLKPMGVHRRHETGLRSDGSTFSLEIGVTEVIKEGQRTFIAVLRDITETLKAQNALRESEQRLSRFFDASLEGLMFHESGKIIDVNNAALKLFNRHLLDIVGKNLGEFLVSDQREILQHMLDSHSPELWESVIECGDGSTLPVEIQTRDVSFDGKVTSITVIRNITERKRAQRALDRHNQFTARILDIVGSLVFVVDAQGYIVRFNKACEQLTGYSFKDVKGKPIWEVMPDLHGGYDIQFLYRRPNADDFPNQRRFEWPTKSGDIRTIDWINSAFVSDDGMVEYVIAAGVDVTDRLLVEKVLANQLQTLERKVKERTRELDAMFTLSPDGFVMINEKRQVVYANPAFFEMTGFGPNQIIGIAEQEFCRLLTGLCDMGDDKATIKGADYFRENNTLRLKRPTDRVINCTVRDIADEREVTSGLVLYVRDITHETEVDQMKSEFLSTAAHEFRTPLSSILGFSELLLTSNIQEEKRANVTEIIYRQSVYLKSLLDELLDLARIDARAGKDFYMSVDTPEQLIREAIENTKSLANDNHVLKVDLPDRWPLVAFDYDKMRQVLGNVFSNAYKYSPEGGEIVCTTVTREQGQQQQFGIKIQDQGIGMTPEELTRVGERFYRADSSGAIPGTGLGVSLVKEIMRIHKGDVEMTSEKSKGTTIVLWLPILNDHPTAKAV